MKTSDFENNKEHETYGKYKSYIGRKFITLGDSRLFREGTVIEVVDIDVRKLKYDNKEHTRFKCKVKKDDSYLKCYDGSDFHYLDCNEFIFGIGFAILEIEQDMKKTIEDRIVSLDSKITKLKQQISSLEEEKEEFTKKNCFFCSFDDCYPRKYDFKKKSFVDCKKVGCDKYVPKQDFIYIGVENYDICQCGSDAGYGDCDTFRWEHRYYIHRVCKRCGGFEIVEHKMIDCSEDWCRCDWNKEDVERLNITPKGWKKDKIIEFNTYEDAKAYYFNNF